MLLTTDSKTDLGISLNLKIVLYLEDLLRLFVPQKSGTRVANLNNGLNLATNLAKPQEVRL
jgi:hypothetical protein